MGHQCCSKQKVKRGLWSPEEDEKLVKYITTHGHGCWSSIPRQAGLQRCGKSCRLRWINYLRPDLKRGSFTDHEERIIVDVHRILGNRWAQIAKHLPGRTDNEVKNFWNSCIKKKLIAQGLDPKTHNLIPNTRPPCINASSNIYHFQPNACTPFTISNLRENDSVKMMAPQASSNPLVFSDAMEISTYQYHDHNAMMNFDDRPNTSQSFDEADFIDDHCCIWDSDQLAALVEESNQKGERKGEEGVLQLVGNNCGFDEQVINGEMAVDVESYGNASFDLGLMGPELMPCEPGFCSGASMEQLQWEC